MQKTITLRMLLFERNEEIPLVSKIMISGDSSYTEAWQLYDLSGNEITEIAGALRDPRYADPDKAR